MILFLLVSIFFEGLARAEVEESGVESSSEEVAVSAFATSICFWGFSSWVLIFFNGLVTEDDDDGAWGEKLVSFLQQMLLEGVITLSIPSAPKDAGEDIVVEITRSGSNRTSIVK